MFEPKQRAVTRGDGHHTGKRQWLCYQRSALTGRVVKVYGGAQAPVSQKFGIQTTARVHADVCDVIDTPSFVLR